MFSERVRGAYILIESTLFRWLGVAVFAAVLGGCFAPSLAAQDSPRFEIGAAYTYVNANAPPGACGCFGLNGGSASAGVYLIPRLDAVAEVTGVSTGNVNGSKEALTLTSYVFGPRFALRTGRFKPFVEALVGGVHAGGLGYGTAARPASALGLMAGGGLDFDVNRRIAVRLVEADYYFTHLANGVNTDESSLRLSFGVVFRFGGQ